MQRETKKGQEDFENNSKANLNIILAPTLIIFFKPTQYLVKLRNKFSAKSLILHMFHCPSVVCPLVCWFYVRYESWSHRAPIAPRSTVFFLSLTFQSPPHLPRSGLFFTPFKYDSFPFLIGASPLRALPPYLVFYLLQ